jgi:hypothetical protein
VLKRFETLPQEQDEDTEIGEHGDGDNWRQVRKLFDAAVLNKAGVKAKRLSAALHSFQAKNEVVRLENEGLKQSLATKGKHKHKSKPLPLQQRKEFYLKAVFWSPSTIREAFVREDVEQREKEQLQLQKKDKKKLEAASRLYNKQIADEAKAARQRERERKKEEKEAKAKELAASRALKQQQRDAVTLQKSHDTHNKGKRAASRKAEKHTPKRRWVVAAASATPAEPPPPSPPAKTTTRGRQIRVPRKYK